MLNEVSLTADRNAFGPLSSTLIGRQGDAEWRRRARLSLFAARSCAHLLDFFSVGPV